MIDWEKLRGALRDARHRQQAHYGLELDVADIVEVVEQWVSDETCQPRIEALKYIDGWIDNKLAMHQPPMMMLHDAARGILDEMRVHIRAAIARLERGGRMEATTPLADA
jgi:hypothetical protein